jgi:hypothetical protein
MRKWVGEGAIRFVELVEVTKTKEYTSKVRRPKKQTGMVKTDVQPKAHEDAAADVTIPIEYTVTPDTDTRDNSPLWVMKIGRHLERNEYKALAESLNGIGGHWSKFKGGFIFRADPTDALETLFPTKTPD